MCGVRKGSDLHFHVNFRIILSISAKNPAGILTEIVLNLSVSLGSECRHPNRTSAFRKRGVSFPLLRSSVISFENIFSLLEYKFCISFVKFIHRHLKILFGV